MKNILKYSFLVVALVIAIVNTKIIIAHAQDFTCPRDNTYVAEETVVEVTKDIDDKVIECTLTDPVSGNRVDGYVGTCESATVPEDYPDCQEFDCTAAAL